MSELPPPGAPDIEIARAVAMRPILPLAEERMGLAAEDLVPFGHHKAKLPLNVIAKLQERPKGKLVLVTAITPTPAGEGKTTTSVGLNDALNLLGRRSAVCLREPSLGPCFGMKGGAAGGGRAQVVPMEDINLHFNGDFHAITMAHNLLSAMLDNHLHWGNALEIDPRRITWRRVMDMNDRALRHMVAGLGGPTDGVPREAGFDITVASEIMAIVCLAEDQSDLQRRIGDIIVARNRRKEPVTCRDLGADGAMAILLKDALAPNIVQTLEHNSAFIHGGPFANIAHGCSSVIATKAALALNDVVVTEAGFGADLGAEKFLDIKCRKAGLAPDAVVMVCTVRALKMHGGKGKSELNEPDAEAVRAGAANLRRHIANLQQFGQSPIIAINRFPTDSDAEIAEVEDLCAGMGATAVCANHWAEGGKGAVDLGRVVIERLDGPPPTLSLLYEDSMPLVDKLHTIATRLYGARGIAMEGGVERQLADFEKLGYGELPVCIAKTQYSFSSDPNAKGAPEGHVLPVREARLAAGAGFVVAVCGDIMTMPGLPRRPAAMDMSIDANGVITGLS